MQKRLPRKLLKRNDEIAGLDISLSCLEGAVRGVESGLLSARGRKGGRSRAERYPSVPSLKG